MKTIWIAIFFCFLEPCAAQDHRIEDSVAIVSFDFESEEKHKGIELAGQNSTVVGIADEAKSFSRSDESNHILIENNKELSSLWRDKDFSIEIWVQTTSDNREFQVIASNEEWNSGEVKDYTDNRYARVSRVSGLNKGWALVCQPDGSWAWNIGNGKAKGDEERVESFRKDYRPTAPRQQINDGEWHHLVFTVNRKANEARLYFDGLNVAIYYMGPVRDLDSGLPVSLASDAKGLDPKLTFNGALDNFRIHDRVLNSEDVAHNYEQLVPMADIARPQVEPVQTLNLMSWNIWHGGRRRGKIIGPQQVIDLIKETNTDIVMMQETYGSGPLIADSLGYYFYLSSANISIISKYPIEKTWVEYHELWTGIARIKLSENQEINLASIWLHYLPGRNYRDPDVTPETLIAGEKKNRHREIKIILDKLKPQIEKADETPLIIGGDFNSSSHLDWVESTKQWHNGLVVEWPVSKEMFTAGFQDSFRQVHPSLKYESPSMSPKQLSNRIDYIYFKGNKLNAVSSDMYFQYKGVWPSDHPAIVTQFSVRK